MVAGVSVVEALEKNTRNVFEQAAESFRKRIAEYREGVRAMAESGGTLPEGQAARLLEVCQALGISPERLAEDTTTIIHERNINARIDEVHARNVAQKEPLPRLSEAYAKAEAEWLRVKTECEQRLKKAEADLNSAMAAFRRVEALRDERTDEDSTKLVQLRGRSPHLYGEITPEQLKRIVSPDGRRSII